MTQTRGGALEPSHHPRSKAIMGKTPRVSLRSQFVIFRQLAVGTTKSCRSLSPSRVWPCSHPCVARLARSKGVARRRARRTVGVTTERLNQQVRRDRQRFPAVLVFQLKAAEFSALTMQNARSKPGRHTREYKTNAPRSATPMLRASPQWSAHRATLRRTNPPSRIQRDPQAH
jgi:ORF6N domain